MGEDQVGAAPTIPRISVAIPAYNEERLLPRLLDSLAAARARYRGDPEAIEVVVGDNASTDATAAIAERGGARVVPVERRAIAAARNGGGRAARGTVLCFVDADSMVHPEVFNAMDAALADPRVGLGATGLRFDRSSLGIDLLVATATPLIRLAGIDGGLVFLLREDFEAVGGYDESLLVAEDVDLLWRVKRRCKARGQRFARLSGVETLTSARKFDKHGDWHFAATGLRLAWNRAFNRKAFERGARKYWYEDR